ncbi:hypothetical protein RDWZM_009801 [Blomia tropicalis]|uniref:Uncharacterized protein n=1 Tax=Blomia tropicalis TaxID=40697 RepID=A0A9Q0M4B0_BLOTA|nr:hypothetical protein RDWZM_009801 [Blomia tropicalis]
MTIGTVISSSSKTGNFLINYRSVEPMDKSFGINVGLSILLFDFLVIFFSDRMKNLYEGDNDVIHSNQVRKEDDDGNEMETIQNNN